MPSDSFAIGSLYFISVIERSRWSRARSSGWHRSIQNKCKASRRGVQNPEPAADKAKNRRGVRAFVRRLRRAGRHLSVPNRRDLGRPLAYRKACSSRRRFPMLRMLLPFSTALATCTPSPQDDVMRNSIPVPATAGQGSREGMPGNQGAAASTMTGQDAGARGQAAQGPIPEPVPVTGSFAPGPAPAPTASAHPASGPGPAKLADSPVEALGRRILSTAFVRVGPDGHLTVELHDGQILVLREVVMHPKKYCGTQMVGRAPGGQYCGRYADVAAARAGAA